MRGSRKSREAVQMENKKGKWEFVRHVIMRGTSPSWKRGQTWEGDKKRVLQQVNETKEKTTASMF